MGMMGWAVLDHWESFLFCCFFCFLRFLVYKFNKQTVISKYFNIKYSFLKNNYYWLRRCIVGVGCERGVFFLLYRAM